MFIRRWLAFLLPIVLIMQGCANPGQQVSPVVKSDTDLIAELHLSEIRSQLEELTTKLYRRNPRELAKTDSLISERIDMLFASSESLEFEELGPSSETQLMELALNQEFTGDRVFCLMAGLIGMINHSYNYQTEFHYLDEELDEQKLYDSARNIERLTWRLQRETDANGELLIHTNGLDPNDLNLSYERLFGKLIAQQDMMAKIASQKNQRMINRVAQSIASFFFIPL